MKSKLSKADRKAGIRRVTMLSIAVHGAIAPDRGDIVETHTACLRCGLPLTLPSKMLDGCVHGGNHQPIDPSFAEYLFPIHIGYQLFAVQSPQRFRRVIKAIQPCEEEMSYANFCLDPEYQEDRKLRPLSWQGIADRCHGELAC